MPFAPVNVLEYRSAYSEIRSRRLWFISKRKLEGFRDLVRVKGKKPPRHVKRGNKNANLISRLD
jgi:hypothetical protein